MDTICNNVRHLIPNSYFSGNGEQYYYHSEWLEQYMTYNRTKVFEIKDKSFYSPQELGVIFCENAEKFSEWINIQCNIGIKSIMQNGAIYVPASKHYDKTCGGHGFTLVGSQVNCDACGKIIKECIGWKEYDICLNCASKYNDYKFKGDIESLYITLEEEYKKRLNLFFGEEKLTIIACKRAIMEFLCVGLFSGDGVVSKVPKDVLILIAKIVWKDRNNFLKSSQKSSLFRKSSQKVPK